MESVFVDALGIPESIFSFVLLPLLIFLARIIDVSINTIRIIYVLGGRRLTATVLGFFESFIWLMAIRQIFDNLDNWICYVAYPAGFAMGILVGMIIEERIAYGKVIIRTITRKDIDTLRVYLQERGFRYSAVKASGPDGDEHIVFTVSEREQLDELLAGIKSIIPTAYYTIERLNRAGDSGMVIQESPRWSIASWLRGVRRN
jgi:uncharacterized protein YebE (UPF0316 family)